MCECKTPMGCKSPCFRCARVERTQGGQADGGLRTTTPARYDFGSPLRDRSGPDAPGHGGGTRRLRPTAKTLDHLGLASAAPVSHRTARCRATMFPVRIRLFSGLTGCRSMTLLRERAPSRSLVQHSENPYRVHA